MVTENFWISSCPSMSSSALIAGCWLRRVQKLSTISRCARKLWSAAARRCSHGPRFRSSILLQDFINMLGLGGLRSFGRVGLQRLRIGHWCLRNPLVLRHAESKPQGCNGKDRKDPKDRRTPRKRGWESFWANRGRNNGGVNMQWVSLNLNCSKSLTWSMANTTQFPVEAGLQGEGMALQQKAMAGPRHGAMGGQLDCWTLMRLKRNQIRLLRAKTFKSDLEASFRWSEASNLTEGKTKQRGGFNYAVVLEPNWLLRGR